MTRRQRRLVLIGAAGLVLVAATGLVLSALNDQLVFFRTPTDLAEKRVGDGERVRMGGLVAEGSVVRSGDTDVRFAVTDTANTITVTYTGILPDLFREGQGVVTEGRLSPDGVFVADTVLAKHDENYMPKEVADALKAQGHWQGEAKVGETKVGETGSSSQ
jgi:cytochrome c-type biogenesis protein CcmE